MSLLSTAPDLVLLVLRAADESPEPEDVKAGWTAFALFLILIAAVALLGWSLSKRLRNAQAAEDAGLYGTDDTPSAPQGPGEPGEPSGEAPTPASSGPSSPSSPTGPTGPTP